MKRMAKVFLIVFSFSFFYGVEVFGQKNDLLRLPFSQYVINADMYDGTTNWKYSETLEHSESIINPPKSGEDWNLWYNKLKEYQTFVRANLKDTSAYFYRISF